MLKKKNMRSIVFLHTRLEQNLLQLKGIEKNWKSVLGKERKNYWQ